MKNKVILMVLAVCMIGASSYASSTNTSASPVTTGLGTVAPVTVALPPALPPGLTNTTVEDKCSIVCTKNKTPGNTFTCTACYGKYGKDGKPPICQTYPAGNPKGNDGVCTITEKASGMDCDLELLDANQKSEYNGKCKNWAPQ